MGGAAWVTCLALASPAKRAYHERSTCVQRVQRGAGAIEGAEFRRIITKFYTRGPFLELFRRKPVQNWSVFGNDARLWAEQMEVTA